MNFRHSRSNDNTLHGLILAVICLVIVFMAIAFLAGCQTSTVNPDGTVVEDPPAVRTQKNLKFWRSELSVAQGAFDGAVISGNISQATADRWKVYIATSQAALGLASNGTDSYACLKNLTCTDAQIDLINRGIGQAIVLLLNITSTLKKT